MATLNKPATGDTNWTTPINDNWTALEGLFAGVCQGRLTLSTGIPVTTTDVASATTLYFTPYKGNRIGLYNGSVWSVYSYTEKSLAIPSTTNTNYDVFIYDNAGTLTLEAVAWTNDTTRVALDLQDGIYVKGSFPTKRYLGTFRTTGTSGRCDDSVSRRFVWNNYNRIQRRLLAQYATETWNWATASWRAANGNTTVGSTRVEFVLGLSEDPTTALVLVTGVCNPNEQGLVGIGLDSTSPSDVLRSTAGSAGTGADTESMTAHYDGIPAIGNHYLQWLEYAVAGGVDFYSTGPSVGPMQGGLMGHLWG